MSFIFILVKQERVKKVEIKKKCTVDILIWGIISIVVCECKTLAVHESFIFYSKEIGYIIDMCVVTFL